MREIKFRGRRLDNGEWGYGYLVVDRGTYISDHATALETTTDYINIDGWRAVDPKTVGQDTGLKDKKGVEIYEGDFLRFDKERPVTGILRFGEHNTSWDKEKVHLGFYFEFIGDERVELLRVEALFWLKEYGGEVIGNIYDNPELLGVGNEQ